MTVYEPVPYLPQFCSAISSLIFDNQYRFELKPASTEWSEPRDSQPWPEPDRKLAAYWKQDDA